MQSSVITTKTILFFNVTAQIGRYSQEWGPVKQDSWIYLNIFEVTDSFLGPVLLPVSLVFWWAQTDLKIKRNIQLMLNILGKETGCQ